MPLSIQIVSDIVCPWCFIGHRRLAQAIESLPTLETTIDWQPYQLHPYLPRQGASYRDHYVRKFGGNVDALRARVEQAGESAGIDFRFDLIERVPNTIAAHTVVSWAPESRVRTSVVERFFEGYFLEGKDLGKPEELAALAADAGMDHDEVAERLARDDDREPVAAEADANRRKGITGVPFFLIGGRYPIVGAQSPETMVQVIQRVLAQESSSHFEGDSV
ncbi:MAG: DsbA family oxidoreductase [Polyangiales bacterium]